MKERRGFAGLRIRGIDTVGFVKVAGRTSPRKVVETGPSTPALRHDVLDVKRCPLQGLMHTTILATAGGPLFDGMLQ
jgi:hypothetical protein